MVRQLHGRGAGGHRATDLTDDVVVVLGGGVPRALRCRAGQGRVVAVGCESRSQFQQFVLPYEAVRTAAVGPDRVAREFLQSTYEAAAELGKRDRAALEVDPDRWQHRLP